MVRPEGRTIAVFRVGEAYYAIDNMCPHMGAELSGGFVEDGIVTCPWHEWRYDVRTGVNTDDAACKVQAYPVKVEGGRLLIKLN